MRESDARTRWKFVTDPQSVTFVFLDETGSPIFQGDEIIYTRRVRGHVSYNSSRWVSGYSEQVQVEVIQLKCILTKSYYSERPMVMKSITVRDKKTGNKFELYRTDKTFNLTGEARRMIEQELKVDAVEELFEDPQIRATVLSEAKNNDDAFNVGI